MRATGVGSVPGEDFSLWTRFVIDTFGRDGIVHIPELPDRGVTARMLGRTLGLVPLPIDLQPAGWRRALGEGIDQRRARSLLAQDLDRFEELIDGLDIAVKQQVTGPLTLAATVEKTRGDKVLSDHGARRELAEGLAEGVREHLADLRGRIGERELYVQVDEPSLPAVLAGRVPTASGFGKHRVVHPPEADALLRLVVEAIRGAGATPVVHSCAPGIPVKLLSAAGFDAVSFDLSLAEASTEWAEVYEGGTGLWFGSNDARQIVEFWGRLGFDQAQHGQRDVVTPPCGLAGRSAQQARAILGAVASAAASLD